MTIRQQLIEAIADALRAITQPDYATDAGLRVFVNRDPANEPLQPEELPAITLRVQSEQVTPLTAAVHEHSMTVEVGGHSSGTSDASSGAWDLMGDIVMALGDDTTFGGLACYCQAQSTDTAVETLGKRVATGRLTLEVRFRTPAWNPTTVHTAPA